MSRDLPSNTDDVIDSRDVIDTIRALTELAEEMPEEADPDYLASLTALAEEASDSPDWEYGETLIHDSYFTDYARELAEDCCPWPRGSAEHEALTSWPYRHIDWDAAAEELKQDYLSVNFDGATYWIRA